MGGMLLAKLIFGWLFYVGKQWRKRGRPVWASTMLYRPSDPPIFSSITLGDTFRLCGSCHMRNT
jgi:hypothetical protein